MNETEGKFYSLQIEKGKEGKRMDIAKAKIVF